MCTLRSFVLAATSFVIASSSASAQTLPVLNRTAALLDAPSSTISTPWQLNTYVPERIGTTPEGTLATASAWRVTLAAQPSATDASSARWFGAVDLFTGLTRHSELELSLPAQVEWPIGISYATTADWVTAARSEGPQGAGWFQISRPEIVLTNIGGVDCILVAYAADGFAQYRKEGSVYVGTNGAAGVITETTATESTPQLFVLHDPYGVDATFFGVTGTTVTTKGQLWKVEAGVGTNRPMAYVGHPSDPALAMSNGFSTYGIKTAWDSAGRHYDYSYITNSANGPVGKLFKIEAFKDATATTPIASVEYTYYTQSNSVKGVPGDLQTVRIHTRMSTGDMLERVNHFRYIVLGAENQQRSMLMAVVGNEGVRSYRFGADENTASPRTVSDVESAPLDATANGLAPYCLWWADVNASGQVQALHAGGQSQANSDCLFSYDVGGIGASWSKRAVVQMPQTPRADGTTGRSALTQYFNAHGLSLATVASDRDPATSGASYWVTRHERDVNERLAAVYSPASIASYTHSTGAIVTQSTTGLVNFIERVTSADITAGFQPAAALDMMSGHRDGVGNARASSFWMERDQFDVRSVVLGPSGSHPLLRVISVASREYPKATTDWNEGASSSDPAVRAFNETTRTIYWNGSSLVRSATVTAQPIVPAAYNGSGNAQTIEEYFDGDERLWFHVSQGARITRFSYDPVTGRLAERIFDFDTALAGAGTLPNKAGTSQPIASTHPASGNNVYENPYHQVSSFTFDDVGRTLSETGPDGRTSRSFYGRLANELSATITIPLVRGTGEQATYFGPAGLYVNSQDGNVHWTGLIQPGARLAAGAATPIGDRYYGTTDNPATWLNWSTRHPLAALPMPATNPDSRHLLSLNRHVYSADGSRLEHTWQYFRLAGTAGSSSGVGTSSRDSVTDANYDQTDAAYDAAGRLVATTSPAGGVQEYEFDALGRIRYSNRGTIRETAGTNTRNMVRVGEFEYDGGVSGGNSLLTRATRHAEPSDDQVFDFRYDDRSRARGTVGPSAPYAFWNVDNLGRQTAAATFGGVRTSYVTGTLPDPLATNVLKRSLSESQYDPLDRLFRKKEYVPDENNAFSSTNAIVSDVWYGPHSKPALVTGEVTQQFQYNRVCQACIQATIASTPKTPTYQAVMTKDQPLGQVLTQAVSFHDRQSGVILAQAYFERPSFWLEQNGQPHSLPAQNQWLYHPDGIYTISQPGLEQFLWTLPATSDPKAPGEIEWLRATRPGEFQEPIDIIDGHPPQGERPNPLTICCGANCTIPTWTLPVELYPELTHTKIDPRLIMCGAIGPQGGYEKQFDDAGREWLGIAYPPPVDCNGNPTVPADQWDYRFGHPIRHTVAPVEIQRDGDGWTPVITAPSPQPIPKMMFPPDLPDRATASKTEWFYPKAIGAGLTYPTDFPPAPSGWNPIADPDRPLAIRNGRPGATNLDGPAPIPPFGTELPGLPRDTMLRYDHAGHLIDSRDGNGNTRHDELDGWGRVKLEQMFPAQLPGESTADWQQRVGLGGGFQTNHEYDDDWALKSAKKYQLIPSGTGFAPASQPSDETRIIIKGGVAYEQRVSYDLGVAPPSATDDLGRYDMRSRHQLARPDDGSRVGWQQLRRLGLELPGGSSPFQGAGGYPVKLSFGDYGDDGASVAPSRMAEPGIDKWISRVSSLRIDADLTLPSSGGTPIAMHGYHGVYRPGMHWIPPIDLQRPIFSPNNRFTGDGPAWINSPPIVTDDIGRVRHDIWRPRDMRSSIGSTDLPRVMDFEIAYDNAHQTKQILDNTFTCGALAPTASLPGVGASEFDEFIERGCDNKPILWLSGTAGTKASGGREFDPATTSSYKSAYGQKPIAAAGQPGEDLAGDGPSAPLAQGHPQPAFTEYETPPATSVRQFQMWWPDTYGNPRTVIHSPTPLTNFGVDPTDQANMRAGDEIYNSFFNQPGQDRNGVTIPEVDDNRHTASTKTTKATPTATPFTAIVPPLYDRGGNMICDGEHWWFDYDAANHLIAAYRIKTNGNKGDLFARFRYNAMGWRIEARYDLSGNGSVADEDDLCERYAYDDAWRLVAIYRNLIDHSVVGASGPVPDVLYQRFVYNAGGIGGFGDHTSGYHDSLVMRERFLPIEPFQASDSKYDTETLYYLQNRRGDVVGLAREEYNAKGDPAGRSLVEQLRYSPYGAPTSFPLADLNYDGRVDKEDDYAWQRLSSDSNARADLNMDGLVNADDKPIFTESYDRWNGMASTGFLVKNPGNDRRGELSYGSQDDVKNWGSSYDNRFGFCGYVWDPFLKIYHVRNRAYDPLKGRWLQQDPLGYLAGDANFYRYVNGNPWDFSDPFGLNPGDEHEPINIQGADSWRQVHALINSGQQQVWISWVRPRDRIDGYYQRTPTGNDFVRTTVNATEADLQYLQSLHAHMVEGARIANQMRTAAEVAIAAGEIAVRLVAPPIDFALSVNDVIHDPTNWVNWAALVPYAGQIKKFTIIVKVNGIEKTIVATEKEVTAMAKGEAKLVQEGEQLVVKDAKAAETACADAGKTTPKMACFVAGTVVATSDGDQPIEKVQVGDRVLTTEADANQTKVDPSTWRTITLDMVNPTCESDHLRIVLLRSPEWVKTTHAAVGQTVDFALPEMGLLGPATVVGNEQCVPIKAGAGRVVLATVTHLNGEIVSIKLATGELLQPTATHRLFCEDRQEWVPASELKSGQSLRTAKTTVVIDAISMKPGVHRVYNLEVETAHSYYAGTSRVLSHNVNPCGEPNLPGINGKGWRGQKAWKDAVKDVGRGGDFNTATHGIPTEAEARALIEEAGGTVKRVEGPHGPNSVSHHNFDHINYETANGTKGTIQIQPPTPPAPQ